MQLLNIRKYVNENVSMFFYYNFEMLKTGCYNILIPTKELKPGFFA